ncbi:protein-tyrosine phosphatase-like protein, partial [Mycena olivaceomarginata]
VINARSVGGFSTSDTDSDIVKPVILFRSADPSRITPKGKEQLLALGVRRVFDFRADDEIAGYKTTAPMIPGVEFLRAPVSESHAFDPVSLAARIAGNELETFVTLYHEILEIGGSAFEQPVKNRTGIFTAVLLMLLGVADEDIIKDYALTSVGLEPYLPLLIERFKQQLPDGNVDNWDGRIEDGELQVSSRPETMAATLNMIREKYGSADKWVTEEDILALRRNFLIKV